MYVQSLYCGSKVDAGTNAVRQEKQSSGCRANTASSCGDRPLPIWPRRLTSFRNRPRNKPVILRYAIYPLFPQSFCSSSFTSFSSSNRLPAFSISMPCRASHPINQQLSFRRHNPHSHPRITRKRYHKRWRRNLPTKQRYLLVLRLSNCRNETRCQN